MRLAESLAFIWKSTRASNSGERLAVPMERITLLYVSQAAITWMPCDGPP